MKKYFYLFTMLLFSKESLFPQSHVIDNIGNTTVYIDSLIGFGPTADQWPWDVEWGAENSLWFTVKDKVCRYDTATHQVYTLLDRPDTNSNSMSIAFHPDFQSHPEVFVTYDLGGYYYSYTGGYMALFKYTYDSANDELLNETEILRWHHNGEHAGGRLATGVDGYIYCTTSEYFFDVDTPGNLNGRILRINPDGSVPAINTSGTYAVSYGHRNPQGIVQVPNGNIFSSELGQHIDELNLIRDYQNYGWPAYDGDECYNTNDSCGSSTFNYTSPVDTAIRPPSGITWYQSFAIPELNGCILQCILSNGGSQGGLVASRLNSTMDDVISDVHYFKGEYKRFRDVTVSPDGKVYVITNDREIPVIRVIYNPNAQIGIEEYSGFNLKLYPNPSGHFVNVISEKLIGKWSITSMDGKELMNGYGTEEIKIDISILINGIYFFKTKNGSKKFVKNM